MYEALDIKKISSTISPLNAISNTSEEKEKKRHTYQVRRQRSYYNTLMADGSQSLRFQGKLIYAERNEITFSLLLELIGMSCNFGETTQQQHIFLFRSLEHT